MDVYQVLSESMNTATPDVAADAGTSAPPPSAAGTFTKVVETGDEGRSGLLLGPLAL
jgi:hypothetical protein